MKKLLLILINETKLNVDIFSIIFVKKKKVILQNDK